MVSLLGRRSVCKPNLSRRTTVAAKPPARASLELREAPLSPRYQRKLHHTTGHSWQVGGAWTSARFRWRQKWRNQRPFLIQHVAWITACLAAMLNASGICPGHLILHLLTKTVNHNPLISFNYFSGRL